jgi:hypothetical protein
MALFKSIRTGVLDKKTAARLQERCLSDYQDATNYEETGVAEITRSKLANRARINIDQTFVDAARRTEAYEDERLKCLKARESDSHLSEPRHDGPYKIVKTGDNNIFTYIPDEYSKEIFKIGCSYQRDKMSKEKAVLIGNSVLQNICAELNVDYHIPAFRFLDEQQNAELLNEKGENNL